MSTERTTPIELAVQARELVSICTGLRDEAAGLGDISLANTLAALVVLSRLVRSLAEEVAVSREIEENLVDAFPALIQSTD